MLTVLQPTLASLGGIIKPDATKQFDKARLYFSLLMYSPEGLQKAVSDKPGRFTAAEYTALLQVICSLHAKVLCPECNSMILPFIRKNKSVPPCGGEKSTAYAVQSLVSCGQPSSRHVYDVLITCMLRLNC